MVYADEKFLKFLKYYVTLKKSWKVLFNDNIFENVDWNY